MNDILRVEGLSKSFYINKKEIQVLKNIHFNVHAGEMIAIVGASSDRSKYGNIAVRSYLEAGYEVFPVHPKETEIEGLKVYPSVAEIPVPLDRVSVYLPPQTGMKVIEQIAQKGTKELFLNPGSESDELVAKARSLGLNVIVACSITALKSQRGLTPSG